MNDFKYNDTFEFTLNEPITKEVLDKLTNAEELPESFLFETPNHKVARYVREDHYSFTLDNLKIKEIVSKLTRAEEQKLKRVLECIKEEINAIEGIEYISFNSEIGSEMYVSRISVINCIDEYLGKIA